jgi:hypothetical protein
LNAATTRNVMAYLIPCNNGSQFLYSHDFSDLLVGKMEATLEGQDINVGIRSNKLGKKVITWPESVVGRLYPIQYKGIFGASDKVRRNVCEEARPLRLDFQRDEVKIHHVIASMQDCWS